MAECQRHCPSNIEVPNKGNGKEGIGRDVGVSDFVVGMDEGTSSRAGAKEVSVQGLGLKNKGTQSMDTYGVEGPAHRPELRLQQRAEENEVPDDPDPENDSLGKVEDKAKSTHVEKGKFAKTRVENDRVDQTDTQRLRGKVETSQPRPLISNMRGMTIHHRNPTHGLRHPTKLLMKVPKIPIIRQS